VTEPGLGPELERFVPSPRALRGDAVLRACAAALALSAAALTLLGELPIIAFLVTLTGTLVGLFWLVSARRGLKRAEQSDRFTLKVHARALVIGDGPDTRTIPFDEIARIDVDEDRLDVVVARTHGPEVRIEPLYPGVEIHDLVARLRNAWRQACDS
jgi:hypothetical protein